MVRYPPRARIGRAVLDMHRTFRRSAPPDSARGRCGLDDALYFCTGETEQKYINLRVQLSVLLVTGCNNWDQGLDVSVEGTAVAVTDDDLLRRLAQAWAAKWDGRWQWDGRDGALHHKEGGAALVFRVTPSKVLAFAKGDFSHTRHVF